MRGLYVITDTSVTDPDLLYRQVGEAIDGGASIVQFRHKTEDKGLYHALAEAVLASCRQHGGPCLINDNALIAQTLGADGAHLGQTDGSLSEARVNLGPGAILGRTCHDSRSLMREAVRDGATYCAFGRLLSPRQETWRKRTIAQAASGTH